MASEERELRRNLILSHGFRSEAELSEAMDWLVAEACLHEARRRLRRLDLSWSEEELLAEARRVARERELV